MNRNDKQEITFDEKGLRGVGELGPPPEPQMFVSFMLCGMISKHLPSSAKPGLDPALVRTARVNVQSPSPLPFGVVLLLCVHKSAVLYRDFVYGPGSRGVGPSV